MHKLDPDFLGRRMQINLVGCGGNGSQMLTGLARLHVTLLALGHPGLKVIAYDPNLVSETNVGRQLFSPADVGRPKAEVLVNRLNMFYGLDWDWKPTVFTDHAVPTDVLISCVDTARARRELALWMKGYPPHYWLDLGNEARTGQVILGQPLTRANATDRWRLRTVTEFFPELLDPKRPEPPGASCSLAQSLDRQDLFINQAVATAGLHLLWTLLRHGQLAWQGQFINLEHGNMVGIRVQEHDAATPVLERPLRKIRRVLIPRKGFYQPAKVLLSCGHVSHSNAKQRARCPKCPVNKAES